MALCQKLYLLALYDNITSTSITEYSSKALLNFSCHCFDCKSIEPDYSKQRFYFDTKFAKHNEYNCK